MDLDLFEKLHQQGLLTDESHQKIKQEAQTPLQSVFWDINTLLSLSVIALSTGLGILVYKNIDTIGHQVVLALIAGISMACFTYCSRKTPAFSPAQVKSPGHLYDYLVLLGTLTMLSFIAYLQFQYEVFGTRYGLATFLPMVLLFFIAYTFDHLAILNLAILNLGVWMGVTITPKQLLLASNYDSAKLIHTYQILGLILLAFAFFTQYYRFKPHFKFSYQHYGLHLIFIATLAAYGYDYDHPASWLWLIALLGLAFLVYWDALQNKSFYFGLLAILYSFIALSCIACRLLLAVPADSGAFMLIFYYFIFAAVGFGWLLKRFSNQIKTS
jgi:hypothetical protein